jgi:hypothetical protein
MLLRWLTYTVPRCVAAPAYIQTIPPTRTGEPAPNTTAATQAAPAPDDCSGGSLLGFSLPSTSRATTALVYDSPDARTRQQPGDARQTDARPSPTPADEADDRPNIFQRFFRWLFSPFRSHKTRSGHARADRPVVNSVTLSRTEISVCGEAGDSVVRVMASARGAENGALAYEFDADAGRLTRGGPNDPHANWDLSGAAPGVHTLTVVARERRSDFEVMSNPYTAELTVTACAPPDSCGSLSMRQERSQSGEKSFDITARTNEGAQEPDSYAWKVSHGRITGGANTKTVTVDFAGVSNSQRITAEVTARLGGKTCRLAREISLGTAAIGGDTFLDGKLVWEGMGVAGATVHAVQGGRVVDSVRTRDDGTFSLNVGFGAYELVAEAVVDGKHVVCKRSVAFTRSTGEVVLEAEDSTGDPTPTPTAEPTSSPTPEPSPEPSPSPSPDASPSPTPGESATPSPTPAASPTPAGQKRKVEDRISVGRPERFLEGQEETVTCELAMVFGEVIPVETFQNGVATVIDKPSTPQGGQAGPLYESFGEDYTSFAQFRLVSEDLDFALDSPAVQPVPAEVGRKADWTWKARLKDATKRSVSFTVRLDVVWRPKTPGGQEIVRSVWERKFENIPVGLPLDVKASKYGSLAGGIGALGLFAAPGLRRRRLEELQAEMDRLQRGAEGETQAGEVAALEAAAPPPTEEAGADELSCTVFARSEASPGDAFLVQVFAHLAGQAGQISARALRSDKHAEELGSETFDTPVARGDKLTVKLDMPGLRIEEPAQSFVWKGEVKGVQFDVTVPESLGPKSLVGKVTFCRNTVPIGHVRFAFEVVAGGGSAGKDAAGAGPPAKAAEAVEPALAGPPVGELVRYRQAFISYCSEDRAEVLRRVQMLRLVKLKFRQDLLDLQPGQEWESALYSWIDESDVFFLFWSRAAKKSDWVEKELQYALGRKGGRDEAPPEIVPVIIEGPPPAPPPPYLSAAHFNDTMQYFVWAEDQMKQAACGPQPAAAPPTDAGAGGS